MKRLIISLMILFFVCGLAYSKDYEVSKQAGDYTINLKMDKNPPISGNNRMEITILDKDGAFVSDAEVTVEYSMPAMAGMPAMNYKSQTQLKDRTYISTINFSMSGAWNVTVKITRAGKPLQVKFNVDVG